jgi:hypothetical protein
VITRAIGDPVNDSISNGAGFTLNYSFNAFNIVSLIYDYNITKYEPSDENDIDKVIQHSGGLGYQHFFTRQLSISSSGGIQYVKYGDDIYHDPYFLLSLIDDIDENNRINLIVARRYQTTLLTNEVFNTWTFSTIFTRQISNRFAFSFSGFYQYGQTVSSLREVDSRLLGITTSGRYNLNENIFVNARYAYTKTYNKQNRPTPYESEYDRNQLEFSATIQNRN